jgi:hypothetical protein
MKYFSVMCCLLTLFTVFGCGADADVPVPPGEHPAEVVRAYEEAATAGDIATCMELLADDVVFRQEPPGMWLEGKDYVRALLEADDVWAHKTDLITPYRTEGNIVFFSLVANGDDLAIVGITDLTMRYQYMVEGGKIVLMYGLPDADEWASAKVYLSGGLGLQYYADGDGFTVSAIALASPVTAAGMTVGDTIIAVDGIACGDMRPSEIDLRLFGPPGSEARLTVRPGDGETTREIIVSRVDITSLRHVGLSFGGGQ